MYTVSGAAIQSKDALTRAAGVLKNRSRLPVASYCPQRRIASLKRGEVIHDVGDKHVPPVDRSWTVVHVAIRDVRIVRGVAGSAAVGNVGGRQRLGPGVRELSVYTLHARTE